MYGFYRAKIIKYINQIRLRKQEGISDESSNLKPWGQK